MKDKLPQILKKIQIMLQKLRRIYLPSKYSVIRPICLRTFSSSNDSGDFISKEKHTFKAQTAKILDIVSKSLYSEKDVFLRELVSNSSDALEKFRFMTAATTVSGSAPDLSRPLEIRIDCNKEKKTLIIQDSGIGMTKTEMLENLGTIGKSGSEEFVKDNKSSTIIGRFGVGFYSAFMVADHVEVSSRSSKSGENETGFIWKSSGKDDFSLEPVESLPFGTKIVIHLKDEEFADVTRVKSAIEKYSNFVSFPIVLNGERLNKVEALWTEEPSKVDQAKHSEFYKFTFSQFEDPMYTLHFRADAPIELKALLYFPKQNPEFPGAPRAKPGVSLYTRKILLEKESEILPPWARFVKGIVDSEDLPLSISRETPQDKALVRKMGKALTKRILRFLNDKATSDPKTYNEFWKEFGIYVKEGVITDFENMHDISKLLRFDTSVLNPGENLASLDEIISRMPSTQKNIYYLSAPNRKLAESSPYYEMFKKQKVEVVFLYHVLDDFCMNNMGRFEGRPLVSAESGAIEDELKRNVSENTQPTLETKELCDWLSKALSDVVRAVSVTHRLEDFPAIVVDHESAALHRMRKLHEHTDPNFVKLGSPKQKLEINPQHKLIRWLDELRKGNNVLSEPLARIIFDGALIQAGIVDDPRESINRFNVLISELLDAQKSKIDFEPKVETEKKEAKQKSNLKTDGSLGEEQINQVFKDMLKPEKN